MKIFFSMVFGIVALGAQEVIYKNAYKSKPHQRSKKTSTALKPLENSDNVCDRDFMKAVTDLSCCYQKSLAEAFQNFRNSFDVSAGISKGGEEKFSLSFKKLKDFALSFPVGKTSSYGKGGGGEVSFRYLHALAVAGSAFDSYNFALEGRLAVDNTRKGFGPVVRLLTKTTLLSLQTQIVAVCQCKGYDDDDDYAYGYNKNKKCPYWTYYERLAKEFTRTSSEYLDDLDFDEKDPQLKLDAVLTSLSDLADTYDKDNEANLGGIMGEAKEALDVDTLIETDSFGKTVGTISDMVGVAALCKGDNCPQIIVAPVEGQIEIPLVLESMKKVVETVEETVVEPVVETVVEGSVETDEIFIDSVVPKSLVDNDGVDEGEEGGVEEGDVEDAGGEEDVEDVEEEGGEEDGGEEGVEEDGAEEGEEVIEWE